VIAADEVPAAVKALHRAFELGDGAIRREEPTGEEHRPVVRPDEDEEGTGDDA
jgi:hypothetical protein